jgi:hypothetical protein
MATVQIAYEVSPAALARVKALLADVAVHDCNWNGADFRIERGDFTCLPDDDSADAVGLLGKIQAAIGNESE